MESSLGQLRESGRTGTTCPSSLSAPEAPMVSASLAVPVSPSTPRDKSQLSTLGGKRSLSHPAPGIETPSKVNSAWLCGSYDLSLAKALPSRLLINVISPICAGLLQEEERDGQAEWTVAVVVKNKAADPAWSCFC